MSTAADLSTKTGTLYGVGVGPGDPELLTLKAARILRTCPVLLLPSSPARDCIAWQIATAALPELRGASRQVLAFAFPMTRDKTKQDAAYDAAFVRIRALLDAGQDCAFLTIGDPTIYSTFMPLARRAQAAGYPVQIVSGIPSFCAGAAAAGISIADGREGIRILPGTEQENLPFSTIYMKSGRGLSSLREDLLAREQEQDLQVTAISNCGRPNERIGRGAAEIPTDQGYLTLVIAKKNRS